MFAIGPSMWGADPGTLIFSAPLTSNALDVVAPAAAETVVVAPSYTGSGGQFNPSGGNSGGNITWAATKVRANNYDIATQLRYRANVSITTTGAGAGDGQRFFQLSSGANEVNFLFAMESSVVRLKSWAYTGGAANELDHGPAPASALYELVWSGNDVLYYVDGALIRTYAGFMRHANSVTVGLPWYGSGGVSQMVMSGLEMRTF